RHTHETAVSDVYWYVGVEPRCFCPGAADAGNRRSAAAICLLTHRTADAVSHLRSEKLGRQGLAADHPDAAWRRRERGHVPRSSRWSADEAGRAAPLHRRVAAGLHTV